MAGVLHPVGPEPAQTYWWRRILVLLAAAIVVLGVVLATTMSSGQATVSAKPPPGSPAAGASSTPAAGQASPQPRSKPTRATPARAAATSARPSSRTDHAAASRTPRPPRRVPTAAKQNSQARPTAPARAPTAAARLPRTPPAPLRPSPPAAKATTPPPPACSAKKLRPTLTGKPNLRPKQATTFALSLINGSDIVCVASISPKNFELKIYSGTDRIYSTRDCRTAVPKLSRTLRPERAMEWTMRWDGRRSRKNCKHESEIPRPGTYFATAQLDGAKPVQRRMLLRG